MQTIKTAFVVILLLTVLYGAHEVLTQPDAKPPQEVAEAARQLPNELVVDTGTETDGPLSLSTAGSAAEDSSTSAGGVPKFDEQAPDSLIAPETRQNDNQEPRRNLSPPPLAPLQGVPELAAQNPDAGSPDAIEPPPATEPRNPGGSFAPADTLPTESGATGPGGNAFAPPPSTDRGNAFVPPTERGATELESPAPPAGSPFAAPNVSAGAPVGGGGFPPAPGNEPPADAGPAAPANDGRFAPSTSLPDPKDVARAMSNDAETGRAQAAGLIDDASQAAQDGASKAQDLADGVRFDPKDALISRGWKAAQEAMRTNNHREALSTLSAVYEDPRLSHQERLRLLDTLDPLAARVIYSTEHHLEQPYEVRRGDRLVTVAEKYDVPWQLLRNINGINDPDFLVPGTKLKVIRGPFRAEVDLASQEMTIYLQRLYAGRFPLGVGNEPAPRPGDYQVQRKELGKQFYASNGVVLPAGDVKNPFGRCWLDLGSDMAIHGSALQGGGPSTPGCIGLSPRDADDVFAILSVGSRVNIR